ncbi:MAG: TIGR00341 family protein [Chloroflexota bacterium]
MALRLIEVIIPEDAKEGAHRLLEEQPILGSWDEPLADSRFLLRILLDAEKSEVVLDLIEQRFSALDGFRVMFFAVEATIPRPEEPEEKAPTGAKPNTEQQSKFRVSREELYADITDSAKVTWVYVVMVILSSIVAAIGILENNVAIIIGAMVIAPLLGPNMALSLSTTLGDIKLGRRAVRANLVGLFVVLLFSLLVGLVATVNTETPEVAARTRVGFDNIALALASGVAGSLAFTTGLAATLIGVMVAVALLPPLVTFGLLLGGGHWTLALGALLLFLTNIICINLAGIVTFLVQGIRPVTWWEADRAKRATRVALLLWGLLLAALAVVTLFSQGWLSVG